MKALSHTSHEEKNLCFWYIECSKSFRHPLYWEWSTYILYLTCAKVVYYKCITLQKGIDEVFGNINIGYLKENTSLFRWLMCWHWEYSASRYNYITGHKSHSKPPVMLVSSKLSSPFFFFVTLFHFSFLGPLTGFFKSTSGRKGKRTNAIIVLPSATSNVSFIGKNFGKIISLMN